MDSVILTFGIQISNYMQTAKILTRMLPIALTLLLWSWDVQAQRRPDNPPAPPAPTTPSTTPPNGMPAAPGRCKLQGAALDTPCIQLGQDLKDFHLYDNETQRIASRRQAC